MSTGISLPSKPQTLFKSANYTNNVHLAEGSKTEPCTAFSGHIPLRSPPPNLEEFLGHSLIPMAFV